MAVEEGKFKLYTKITPPLEAGDWCFEATQNLTAKTPQGNLDNGDLRIDKENIYVRIRSPRYVLPPDQVLSTYPPANSFGSYGNRLPQVVIKRRTLPWERKLNGAGDNTPWLALVLIAQGEAGLATAVDVANCVTPGVTLEGIAEVAKGNCLVVHKSIIDKVFPTRQDLELLAHAREVDIHDTELMMGDDDGFLAVVVSNRLPVPAQNDAGETVPVKYLACLINLEGQYEALLERSPTPGYETDISNKYRLEKDNPLPVPDHLIMRTAGAFRPGIDLGVPISGGIYTGNNGASPYNNASQWTYNEYSSTSSADISNTMALDFRVRMNFIKNQDTEYRFPVLLHWSFTTTGDTTFRTLMENLDSRLLGDVGDKPSDLSGRLPLEVVESGHVGLNHKTREGDEVRSWYRGPLVPHPTLASDRDRLPLAHSSDQLRIVIPDGREDLSLASGFEIGRLLTLSQPSIIASLMRWRQDQYHVARLTSMLMVNKPLWEEIIPDFDFKELYRLGPMLGHILVDAIIRKPESLLGQPRPKVSRGRPLNYDGIATEVMATGLGLPVNIFRGDLIEVLEILRRVQVPVVDFNVNEVGVVGIRESLEADLNRQRVDLVSNVLSNKMLDDALTGPAFPVTNNIRLKESPDVLDRILTNAIRASRSNEEE